MRAAGVILLAGAALAATASVSAVAASTTNPTGYTHPTYPTSTISTSTLPPTTSTLPQCPLEPCSTNPQGNTTTTVEVTTSTTTTTAPAGTTTTVAASTTTSPTASSSSSVAPTSTTSPPPSTSSASTTTTSSTPPTASSTTTTTTTLPATLDIGSASTVCTGDVPFVTLTFGNQPAFNGHVGTITFVDLDGNTIETHSVTYQANETITLLYPGATIDANGNATDWPGWMLNDDGFWILDPTDARYRDGITIVAEINPTATTDIAYPPSTAACNSPAGPFPPEAPPVNPPTLPRTR